MARASFLGRIVNKFKEWVSGGNKGGNTKKSSSSSSSSRYSNNRPSYTRMGGGGGGVNRRELVNRLNSGGNGRPTYKSMAEATKSSKDKGLAAAIDEKTNTAKYFDRQNGVKKEPPAPSSANKDNATPDPKQAAAQKSKERAKATLGKAKDTLRDNAKYFGNDTERETIAAIKKWNESNKQQKKEFNERTNHKYDVEYWEKKGDKKKAQEARIRVKSGENTSDIVAEELAVKYHPTAMSAARGAASGATFGASELAIKAQAKRDKERAKNEQYYQENKNKTAETVGELAGALASFGVTAGATDRLGAKVVSKVAPNAAENLAKTKLVQGLAKRGVNKALGGASEELIKQVGEAKAKKIVAAVGNDIVQNATTGLLYDFNKASAAHEIGSKEWRKEMGRSAAFNAAVTGGIAGGAILGGNKRLATEEAIKLFEKQRKQAVEEGAEGVKTFLHTKRGIGAGNLPRERGRLFGESLDDRFAREKADELGRLGKAGYVKQAPDAKVSLNRKRRADVVLSNEQPLKANDDIDSLIDDALDSATKVEDYMELGFSRAEAEILARPIRVDKAAKEEVRFNPYLFDEWGAQQKGMSIRKGNIKPLAENLKANELISHSRNAEWRTLPRSAERMDTSVEGLTKRLEELKAQKPQTDKEARELRTKINDVEDYLDRAKWRKEGGSNMDAMRKAYQGEYDGFDMRASTNSHQSDVLEGKVKGKTATIVEMSPDEYMERAYRQIFKKSSEKGAKYADHLVSIDEDVQKYAEAMRNGDKFPLPYLDFTNAGQEGRHRAMAAKMAGIDKIPVVVIDDAANPKALIDDAAEAVESQSVPSMRQKEYTLKVKYKSGKTYTRKVNALSDTEALDIITKNKGVDNARIIGSSEITPKGTKSAAENLQTKELTQEEKRNNILNFIGEGDEATPAVEATAKGTKPAANTLNAKANTAPKADEFKPQSIDDITNNSGVKHEKVSNKEKTRDFWSSFRTKFVDSLDAYEQWNKQFLKTDPEKWALNNGAIDKLRRSQAQAARSIGNVQLGWNGKPLKSTLADGDAKSLKAIYDGLDEEREKLFETYLLLKHAPDRAAAGKPIYKGRYASAEACEKDAKEILAKNKDFEQRAEELYQYTRNELQNRADAGLLPQEVVDDWFKKYPHYVPTGRAGEFKPDEDIWEVAHDLARNGNTVKAGDIKAAEKNVSDLPIRSIKEQLSEATTRNWRDMSLNNLLRRMYGDEIASKLAVEADGGLATVLDNTVNLKSGKGGKYYAEVFIDGKANRVEIEKRFYDAIKDLNKNGRVGDAIDFASDVAAVPSHLFKNVVTSWNPIFMVKNGMRDFPEAIINSRYTKEFIDSMGLAKRDLYGVQGGGMWTQALRNQGVSQANFVNLEEALTKERDGLIGAAGKAADKFATLQESVETYPRLVEFMATVKGMGYDLNTGLPKEVAESLGKELAKDGYDLSKGIDELPEDVLAKAENFVRDLGYDLRAGVDNVPMEVLDVAAANAADVTVNFGRSGSIGKMLNRGFVPFFNPSVQGFDKFIRNLSQQPSGKALLGTIAKAFALGTGATAINNMLLSDNPYYQQIAAREKATNIIIACPIKFEDGKMSVVDADEANVFIKIPKSRFAAAYSIPMVNVANDNKMGWAEMIKVVGDQVAPVNPVESNILAPFVLAAKNKTWYGTPIVSQGIENKTNPSQEYDANTSLIGKALGKATSKLPTELQISPKKADYILDATTGVIGDFALPMLTPSRQGDGGFVNKYIAHPAGNVVKRAFTIDANTQNDLSTRFYNELQKATDNSNSDIGTAEDKEEYKRLNAYSKETAGINQAIRYLQGSDSKTKQKDIYELQKVRNQLMQDALDGKGVPTSEKMLDAVQKYVGTTYAVDSFGSSADKDAMRVYGEAVYGNLSEDEMKKRIDSDTNFYNGVRAIGGLEDKLKSEGLKGTSVLSRAVALASANASDDLFGAYECTKQSRTETANKMTRAKDYISNGGSEDEFVKLEKVRKEVGKLPDEEKDSELEKVHAQLANGEISYEEFYNKQGEIEYNANISRVGLATSLALANSPERAYRLYDLKDRNIQKGINLAAMGYDARSYREMAKAVDTSGNGYLSKQEVIDYVANSGASDKATLFDALYPYNIKYNPFGTATNYSVAQAAEAGRRNGIESIGGVNNDFTISADSGSSGSSYGGYSGRRKYRSGGGGGKAKVPTINAKSMAAATKSAKGTKVKLEPPTPKTTPKVTTKFRKYDI